MTPRGRFTTSNVALNLARVLLMFAIFAAQFDPLARWRWHEVIVIGGLAIFTVDWLIGTRRVSRRLVPIFTAGALYTGATAVGLATAAADGPRPILVACAISAVAAALAALALAVREGRRTTELDRLIFSEASSIAFFATIIAIVTVALIDTWFGFRAPSPWIFAAVGAVSWLGARIALQSRYH